MSSRHLVDPELNDVLTLFGAFTVNAETLPILRGMPPLPRAEPPPGAPPVELTRRTIPGPVGAPDVEVLVYRPVAAAGPLPGILHIHGGGYVIGDAAGMEAQHLAIAGELGCVIVSANYRLAPETVFPGAVEDCYAALAWSVASAEALGLDPARIGVMGESAGGGLAAALALLARDRGEYPLAFQHLIYPMLDDRTAAAPDRHPLTGEFVWNQAANVFGWSALLGVAPGSPGVSPYAAAARAEDLAGLPPAFISTGALDLFLEEDLDYARRLTRAGVPVELHVYPGAFHAFDLSPTAKVAAQARRDSLEALRRALRRGG